MMLVAILDSSRDTGVTQPCNLREAVSESIAWQTPGQPTRNYIQHIKANRGQAVALMLFLDPPILRTNIRQQGKEKIWQISCSWEICWLRCSCPKSKQGNTEDKTLFPCQLCTRLKRTVTSPTRRGNGPRLHQGRFQLWQQKVLTSTRTGSPGK